MVQFHQALSEETIYQRYFEHMTVDAVSGMTGSCASARMTTIPLRWWRSDRHQRSSAAILAVGRLSKTDNPVKADFALLVNDKGRGAALVPP